jgi:hypothetical protein
MLFDGVADHWPDLLLAALLAVGGGCCAVIGWFLKRDISGMDKRHERAENKFGEQDKTLSDHETRITVIEKVPPRER